MKKFFLIVLCINLLITPSLAEMKTFRVERVIDGDTIVLKNQTRVRLIGIDAPEKSSKECYWKKSKNKLQELVEGRRVKLRYDQDKLDQYGRKLAYVYLGDTFINKLMLTQGLAEWMIVAPNDQKETVLYNAQQKAKNKMRGIWAHCDAVDDSNEVLEDNDADNDGIDSPADCNDNDSSVSSESTYYADTDDDGLGDPSSSISACTASAPDGYVSNNDDVSGEIEVDTDQDDDGTESNSDCDDNDSSISSEETYYADSDHDGLGDPSSSTTVCSSTPPTGYVTNDNDVSGEIEVSYICSSNFYNCSDFSNQTDAQEVYNYCISEVGTDVHRLDGDDNGLACESL